MNISTVLLPLFISAAILIFLGIYQLAFRNNSEAVLFGLIMFLGAAWAILYALEVVAVDVSAKVFWTRLRMIPIDVIPVLWLLLVFHYIGRSDWLTLGRITALMAEPVLAVVLAITSGTSTLFRYDYHVDPLGASPALLYTNGVLYPFHLFYIYGLFCASIFLISSFARGRQPIFKRQSVAMAAGTAFPVIVDAFFQLRIISWMGVSPAPMALAVSGIAAAVALLRYRFLDIVPIASSLVMETLDDLLLILDAQGRLIDFNPRARTSIGFDPRTAVGKAVDTLPAPWSAILARFAKVISARDRVDVPVGDGVQTFDLAASPIRDQLGRARGRLLLLHNVTERKLAEEELQVSRERLQLAFDSASDGLWDWEVTTGRMYWSPRYYMMLGYQPGEIEASFDSWKSLIHADDVGRVLQGIGGLLRDRGEMTVMELRMRTRDGGWRWVLSRGKVVKKDERGNALRIVGTHVDITDRREMEDRLRESEEKFRSFIEQAAEAIMLADETGLIIEFNPAAERMVDLRRDQAIGMPIWALMGRMKPRDGWSVETESEIRDRFNAALQTGEGDMLRRLTETTLRRPDGTQRHFQQYIFPIRTKSGWRIGSISHDITNTVLAEAALQKSQEQLVQAQKMEAVGRLAGGIAHDFNNLLTVISGYSDLVHGGLPDESPLKDDVREIMRASERAATLTSQLLAFSRKQVLQPRTVVLNDLVRNMGKMLRRVIGEDVELATHLQPEAGCIRADPGQIEQVIMNLAVNARDAMPEGGILTVETARVRVDEPFAHEHPEMKPGEFVKLSVSDNGRGMDELTRSRIFEPFFTTKEMGKGTGLGLPTAYGIIKQSDGNIFCYSEPGKGSTFTIYFPRILSHGPVESVQEREKAAVEGTETILLVEDEEAVRGFTATILRKNGYTVVEAESGADALAEVSSRGCVFRLLVTDVVMPQMSGRELARRASVLCGGIKVLYVSGYTEDAIVHHGILEQGIEFMQKPYSAGVLLKRVREILDKK